MYVRVCLRVCVFVDRYLKKGFYVQQHDDELSERRFFL